MPFDTYAYFYVTNFEGDASEISKQLQLIPTETRHKGDTINAYRQRSRSDWHLHSPLPRTENAQDSHLKALLELLESKREQVLKVCSMYDCGISCVGYYTDENPGFHLDSDLISRLASFGLSVDFDLYCHHDENARQGRDCYKAE
jgi:hypothetical protein